MFGQLLANLSHRSFEFFPYDINVHLVCSDSPVVPDFKTTGPGSNSTANYSSTPFVPDFVTTTGPESNTTANHSSKPTPFEPDFETTTGTGLKKIANHSSRRPVSKDCFV